MPFFSWRARRQLVVFGILFVGIAGILWYSVSAVIPNATCVDKKQNQGEEGVDCGGPCAPCLVNLSDPVVLWSRFFPLAPGVYEAAALVENTHNVAAADRATYHVKLYDANNLLITERTGETYVNPGERFLILEPGLSAGERTPSRVLVEFDPILWRNADYAKPDVLVVSRDFTALPQPRLLMTLRNAGSSDLADVQVAAILKDATGNAYAASVTRVDALPSQSEKTVSFSWPPGAFADAPAAVEALVRTQASR